MNKNTKFLRLIQTRTKPGACVHSRFPNLTKCISYDNIDKSDFVIINNTTNTNFTYKYQKNSKRTIQGIYNDYDGSGHFADVPVKPESLFNHAIQDMKSIKWVDENTLSLITEFNFYNINLDLVLTVRLLYENIDSFFQLITIDYGLVDITPIFDIYLVWAIIFSIAYLLYYLVTLKSPKANKHKIPPKDIKRYGTWAQILRHKRNIANYFRNNYRKPNIAENISKILFKNFSNSQFRIFLCSCYI